MGAGWLRCPPDQHRHRRDPAGRVRRLRLSAPADPQLLRLARRIGDKLLRSGSRLVTAESCTAGWIAKALTDVPGSSAWFDCGFVTYSNAAKRRMLGVPARILERHGAVSSETVRAMAAGALKKAPGAQFAVAVSGIAGPDGGAPGKPVGTVWFCVAVRHGRAGAVARHGGFAEGRVAGWTRVRGGAVSAGAASQRGRRAAFGSALKHFRGNRETVRRRSVAQALAMVLRCIA